MAIIIQEIISILKPIKSQFHLYGVKEIIRIKTIIILFLLVSILSIGLPVESYQAILPPPSKGKLIFYESFDSFDSINNNGGIFNNIELLDGKSWKGALIQGNANLVYPAENHFNYLKGTIEFWIQPSWDAGADLNSKPKYLLTIIWGNTQQMLLYVDAQSPPSPINNYLIARFASQGSYFGEIQSLEPYTVMMKWKPDTWHKVNVFWDFTIPNDSSGNNQSYLVMKIDDTYTQCQKVAPVAPEAMLPNASIIVGQKNGGWGLYPANAIMDELKIYGDSLLPVVPFPEYQFNPLYPATEVTFRKLFAGDGICENFKTYKTDPADCPKLSDSIMSGQNILFFQRPAFEQVYENYVPQASEINTQFNYQVPPGEFETIFFNVYSRIDLTNVTVTYTDFKGADKTIPKSNLDLRVVKNWFQASRGAGTSADPLPWYTPDLLLQNDQIPLDTDPTLGQYKVPSLPIQDYAQTRLHQYTSRQFAMIVNVPAGTPAGNYLSTVTLQATGVPNQQITLNLEVLPFALRDSGKIYSIWLSLDEDSGYAGRMGIDIWQILTKNLTDIKNHGFNSINFFSYNDATQYTPLTALQVATKKVAAAQQLGFKKAVIYTGLRPNTLTQEITPDLANMMVQHGFEPWLYGVDEFGELGLNYMMSEQITKSRWIHQGVGGKVVSSTTKAASDALDDPNNAVYSSFPAGTYEPLDWAIYVVCDAYLSNLMTGTAQKNPNKIETFYWQGRDENPQTNRYYLGYFPMITGLDGASPTLYRAGGSNNQFWNDFDWPAPSKRFRPYNVSYPSVQGPVPTMEWEAAREGIKDGKYLSTWKYYKDEAAKKNPALAQLSEAVVNNILEHYRDRVPTVNIALNRNSMAQYADDRRAIIKEINKLIDATKINSAVR